MLRIVFRKPSLMLDVATTLLWVDGLPVWRAPFADGVDVQVPLAPGRHYVDVRIDVEGLFARNRRYEVDAVGPARMDLSYSRMWGNFKKRARFSAAP